MVLTLESSALQVELDPDRGGNIHSIRTPESSNWLFYDPTRAPTGPGQALAYDDVWCGGFEELFPNDAPCVFDGRTLPDHGELWNASLAVVSTGERSVQLRRECTSVPATFEKHIRLDPRGPSLAIDYKVTNTGTVPLSFLFKLHPAMAIEPGDRILLPGGTVTPVDPAFGTNYGGGAASWPMVPDRAGGTLDLSRVPSRESRRQEFVYVKDIPAGWCGLERASSGERIVFTFPLSVFPYCWLFLTYGGWREYYTAVLEPCTNMPKDLNEARSAGQCAVLAPGAHLACTVNISIHSRHG